MFTHYYLERIPTPNLPIHQTLSSGHMMNWLHPVCSRRRCHPLCSHSPCIHVAPFPDLVWTGSHIVCCSTCGCVPDHQLSGLCWAPGQHSQWTTGSALLPRLPAVLSARRLGSWGTLSYLLHGQHRAVSPICTGEIHSQMRLSGRGGNHKPVKEDGTPLL